jgi:hypothetical protein
MYSRSKPASCEQFLDHLDKLPWCKQGDSKLVAVHHCSPEVIEVLRSHDHDVKVNPGGVHIKLNKSTINTLQEKCEAGEAIPLLLIWIDGGVELSFRTHKSSEFPYDMWQNPAAAAYETESIFISAQELGERVSECFKKHLLQAKTCPTNIPQL